MLFDGMVSARANLAAGTFLWVLACVVLVGCADDAGDGDTSDMAADLGRGDMFFDSEVDGSESSTISDTFSVRPSVEQLHIWGSPINTPFEVLGPEGEVVATGTSDDWGSLVFRQLEPGDGYTVRVADDPEDFTDQLEVMSIEGSLPDESFYAGQTLEPGFGYLTTRDGTTVSVFISLPGPPVTR